MDFFMRNINVDGDEKRSKFNVQAMFIHTHSFLSIFELFYFRYAFKTFFSRSSYVVKFLFTALGWKIDRASDFSKKYFPKCPPAQTTNLMRWSNIDKAIRLWFAKTLTFWHSPSARENNFKMRVQNREFSIQEQTVVKICRMTASRR